MDTPTSDNSKNDYSRKERSVKTALFYIQNSDEFRDDRDFWDKIKPLVTALKEHDHKIICDQLTFNMSESEYMKRTIKKRILWIIGDPERYGVDELTKTDVIEIMRTFQGYDDYIPTSASGRRNWWNEITSGTDIKIKQGRKGCHPNLKKWLKETMANKKIFPLILKKEVIAMFKKRAK